MKRDTRMVVLRESKREFGKVRPVPGVVRSLLLLATLLVLGPDALLAQRVVRLGGGAKPAAENPLGDRLRRTQQGRVVDVLGDPLPAATLEVLYGEQVVGRAVTDAEGLYQLRAPAVSGAFVRVAAAGKASVRRLFGGRAWRPVQNFVLEDGCTIRGAVVDAVGRPVAGVTVVLAGGETRCSTVTDDAGRFELAGVPMRRVSLRAWGRQSFAERTLWPTRDVECDLKLPLFSSGQRRIRVEGLPREALASAVVEVTSTDMVVQRQAGRLTLGVDGTTEFLPGETSLLRLRAPGFDAEPSGWLVTPTGAGELVFAVRPVAKRPVGCLLTGRLVDPDDRPVIEAELVVEDRLHGRVGVGTTGVDGTFRIPVELQEGSYCCFGIAQRDWQFVVEEDGLRSGGYSWFDAEVQPRPVTLRVERCTAVASEVRDALGNRFTHGELFVAPSDRPLFVAVRSLTDRLGAFDLRGLVPGEYMLAAVAFDGGVATAEIVVAERATRVAKRWLPVPSGSLEGQVVGLDGRPMPGVRVRLVSPEQIDGEGLPLGGRPDAEVLTNRDGRFRCRGLHAGDWLVALPDEDGVAAVTVEIRIDRAAPVDFRLTR
ncbi:MAG: carboxypeptidase-like regulatory domain-containing protein [bacterium]|nr:carboxypeptidase-like regulatory domain-containing protein [bacterium]